MSDPLRPASFKGVPFYVQETSAEFGRRKVLHEYPFRDLPYGEDIGRAARTFSMRGFLKTQAELDTFISEALESEGAGTLIHPWYGSVYVQLENKGQIRWPAVAGGLIELDLSFEEAGENTEPSASDDTESLLDQAADAALSDITDVFGEEWLSDMTGWVEEGQTALNGLFETLESYLDPYDQAKAMIDRIANALQGMINDPLGLASRIQSRIDALMNIGQFSGMTAVRSLLNGKVLSAFNKSDDKSSSGSPGKPNASTESVPAWTLPAPDPEQGALPPLPPALADVVRRTLIIETARILPYSEFNSKLDVAEARNRLMQWLSNELNYAPDDLYHSLQNLQIATANAFFTEQLKARDVVTHVTQATLPALVIAYQVNGHTRLVDDLVSRNRVRHAGFVPAGKVEVLTDGQ